MSKTPPSAGIVPEIEQAGPTSAPDAPNEALPSAINPHDMLDDIKGLIEAQAADEKMDGRVLNALIGLVAVVRSVLPPR